MNLLGGVSNFLMRVQVGDIIGPIDPLDVPTTGAEVNSTISTVISLAYAVAGVATVGFIIYGGYMIIMSKGDPQELQKGQTTLANALIGLVVVVASGLIFNFVADLLGVGSMVKILDFGF